MSAPTSVQWLRAAVGRVCVGTERLAVHLAGRTVRKAKAWYEGVRGWLGGASGLGWWARLALLVLIGAILRKIITGVAGSAYRRIEAGAWDWMLWPAAALWVIAAYRTGHPDWTPKAPAPAAGEAPDGEPENEEPSDTGSDTSDQQPEHEPQQVVLPSLEDVRQAVARIGTPHAHLAALATELGTAPHHLRQALDGWGVPVEAVRMRGRGTSTGVKGDNFPAPSIPSDRVVAAGQTANNDDNNNAPTVPLETVVRVDRIGHGGTVVHRSVSDH